MSLVLLFLPATPSSSAPTVSTDSLSALTTSSFNANGTVSSDGGASVTDRGFVYGLSSNPTTSNNKQSVSGTTGAMTALIINLTPGTTYHVRAYAINSVGTSYGVDLSITLASDSPAPTPISPGNTTASIVKKRFYYKIYSNSLQYITTWMSDVISYPTFQTILNGGPGQLTVRLARTYDNFGEGLDVKLGNKIELWSAGNSNLGISTGTYWDQAVWDVDFWDSPLQSYLKIYSGYISQYSPTIDNESQYVDITILGYVSEASYRILKDNSGNTTITYNSKDPSDIMTDIIDKYRADGGVNINYAPNSIVLTGSTVSYTFNNNTIEECLDKIVELCPEGWYWFMDANGIVYLKQSHINLADHSVKIGKDVMYMEAIKRIENMTNAVALVGGGSPNLFRYYTRPASIAQYGKFERKIQDGRVTDTGTADIMAKRTIDINDTPETRVVLQIADKNGENSNSGQNIESFQIGDTLQLKNYKYGTAGITFWDKAIWDKDVWDRTYQYIPADILLIVSIIYNYDYIQIEAVSRLPEVAKRIEDINRNLDTQIQENLPIAPTILII